VFSESIFSVSGIFSKYHFFHWTAAGRDAEFVLTRMDFATGASKPLLPETLS